MKRHRFSGSSKRAAWASGSQEDSRLDKPCRNGFCSCRLLAQARLFLADGCLDVIAIAVSDEPAHLEPVGLGPETRASLDDVETVVVPDGVERQFQLPLAARLGPQAAVRVIDGSRRHRWRERGAMQPPR